MQHSVRPQPLGIFPYPAGLLLLPWPDSLDGDAPADVQAASDALTQLMRGVVPDSWPTAWTFYAEALEGNRAQALAGLPRHRDAITSYNRFILGGDDDDRQHAANTGDATLRALTHMAAYVMGLEETPHDPTATHNPPPTNRELIAHSHLVRASWYLEQGNVDRAAGELDAGVAAARVASPLLAAQLLAQRASLDDASDLTEQLWRDAITLAGETPLRTLRAELWAGLAMAVHQRAEQQRHRLVEAVQHYQQALRDIDRESQPDLWARIQANLGLVYVAMPMSAEGEKLRLAVAVQAFREALTVYTRETHPDEWTSTMLNMANAMQYLPSAHQAENLADAVTAYEELLTVRPKALDPVGHARLLANQGNALAHLGIFGPAVEKLTEAHKLLHWHGESDAATRLLAQLEQINTQLASAGATPGAP